MQKSLKPIRVVVYDCDGVLFDSRQANIAYYNNLLARFGKPPLGEDALAVVHQETVVRSLDFLFRGDARRDEALREIKTIDYKPYFRLMTMEPYLVETLRALRPGLRTAVATNRTTTIVPLLIETDLEKHFDLVVSALDVDNPKPHPESLQRVAGYFRVEPQYILFIGDSHSDQQAAESAGTLFAAYKNPSLHADFHISDHRQVLELLKN